jgi:hypothetical protein
MQINVTEIVIWVVGLVFTAVVIPLTKAAFGWLKGKTQNEALKSALSEAQTIADNVVASLQANVVEGLKSKSADGKLSTEDIKDVGSRALDMFLSDISGRSLSVIRENSEDITQYIGNLIEARLMAAKSQGAN